MFGFEQTKYFQRMFASFMYSSIIYVCIYTYIFIFMYKVIFIIYMFLYPERSTLNLPTKFVTHTVKRRRCELTLSF